MPQSPFALVPAAYVLLMRAGAGGDEVLLQRRTATGYMDDHWAASAAGHVEKGESCEGAAVREAREELGVMLAERALVPLCALHRSGRTDRPVDQRVDFFFLAREWSGEPGIVEHKASALEWFGLDALPDPVVPHELMVLTAVREGAVQPVMSVGFAST